ASRCLNRRGNHVMKHVVVVLTLTFTLLLFSPKASASTDNGADSNPPNLVTANAQATSNTPDSQVIAQSAPATSNNPTDFIIAQGTGGSISPVLYSIMGLLASTLKP